MVPTICTMIRSCGGYLFNLNLHMMKRHWCFVTSASETNPVSDLDLVQGLNDVLKESQYLMGWDRLLKMAPFQAFSNRIPIPFAGNPSEIW